MIYHIAVKFEPQGWTATCIELSCHTRNAGSENEAAAGVIALSLRILAGRIEAGPIPAGLSFDIRFEVERQ